MKNGDQTGIWVHNMPKRPLSLRWVEPSSRKTRFQDSFHWLLIALAGGFLSVITIWLAVASRTPIVFTGEEPVQGRPMEVVLTRLSAREVSSATAQSYIQAATAELLSGWAGLYLQEVEAHLTTFEETEIAGVLMDTTGTVYLKADQGWIDSSEGNLLLVGNILAERDDGMSVRADRLEYEAAADEIRFVSAHLQAAGVENRAPMVTTDPHLNRIRFGTKYESKHPFFARYSGGIGHEQAILE